MKTEFKPGEVVLAFDSREWSEHGDVGDNSKFWKRAEIVTLYHLRGDYLAEIYFLQEHRMSRGHFVSGLKKVNQKDLTKTS